MNPRRRFGLAILVAALLGSGLSSCASSKSKPDDSAQKAKSASQTSGEKAEKVRDTVIPDLEPLELRETAPSAEKVGEKQGVSAYRIGSLTVLHKPTPANQVVSAKLFVDGGVANMTDTTSGIERLALRLAVTGGTESTPKDEFTSSLDSMGSSVQTFFSRDFSGYELRCITKHFDESWDLFSQAILEPAMPEGELEVQRKKQLANIEQLTENPNRYVGLVVRRMMAGDGHPYRFIHLGTRENVESFGRKDLLAYQRSLLNPARMVLVVVGDVSTDKILKKAKTSLGRLQSSEWSSPDLPKLQEGKLALESRKKSIPTNYIMGKFRAPSPGDEDYAALRVAMSYLSDRLFEEIRTKRNLSYAVSAGVTSRRSSAGYLYVSAKQPERTLQVMFEEVKKLKDKTLTKKQLQRTRNVFITNHYKSLETNSNLASDLGHAELVEGDWRRYATFLQRLKSVTPRQVREVANEYMDDYRFAMIGNPDALDRKALQKMTAAK